MFEKADLIIKNGRLFSADLDGRVHWYDAAAVRDGKIITAGTDDEIAGYYSENTEIIDAEGATVLPGLCDSHAHGSYAVELICGAQAYNIEPEHDETREAYIDRLLENVKAYIAEHPDEASIRAAGWNPSVFQEDPDGLPTCHDLDRICDDKPLLMKSYCHHYLWVNSEALELSGITGDKVTPDGYIMYKDENGNPTGIFQEFPAMMDVLFSFDGADYSVEEYMKGILSYQENWALKNGTTCFFDPVLTPNSLHAYRALAENGDLKLRVNGAILADPTKPVSQFDKWIEEKGCYDIEDKLKINTVKFFFDGSGFEMYLNEPFEKEILDANSLPENYAGREIWSPEKAKEAFLYAASAGFNIHVHSMGDGGVREALDAFEYVASQGIDLKKQRHVITHLMLIDDRDINRMDKLGIIAAMQPHWGMYDSFAENYMVPMLGKHIGSLHYKRSISDIF